MLLLHILLLAASAALAKVQAPALPGAQPISSEDRIYTGDQSSNTITVINPGTNEVLGTISLGDSRLTNLLNPQYLRSVNSHGLGFSRDGKFVVSISVTSNTVNVIRTLDNSIVSQTYTDRAPHEAFFTADNRTVWVACRGTSFVDIIDGLAGGVIGRVKTAPGPSKVLFSPDGQTAYVNHILSPTVSIIDVATHTVVATISGLADKFSSDMMLSADGTRLWVAHKMIGQTSIIDLTTRSIVTFLPTGPETNHPNFAIINGITYGFVTVAAINATKVYRQDTPAAVPAFVTAIRASGIEPHGIWPSPDNTRMYVVNEHSDTVDVIDTLTLSVIDTLHVGQEGQALVYVAGAVPKGTDRSVYTANLGRQGLSERVENVLVSVVSNNGSMTATDGSALITVRQLPGLDMLQIIGRHLHANVTYVLSASPVSSGAPITGVQLPLIEFNATVPDPTGCAVAPQVLGFVKVFGVYAFDSFMIEPKGASQHSMPSSVAGHPSSTSNTEPTNSMAYCGYGLNVCQVIAPTRTEQPWAGSTNAYPQCYDPTVYTCTSNFLCPGNAPKVAGKYACGPITTPQAFAQTGSVYPSSSPSSTTSVINPQISVVVNAPGAGDIDGVEGFNFMIDITVGATAAASNSVIPFEPLYQDANSSTFGPGLNAAFPGLVVLMNTTMTKGPLTGPKTNLAGLFQLNGVAKVDGLNQYHTVWLAGAPLFGIGASELTVYYVNGKAGKEMTATPGVSDSLVSNVVQIPFTISNRTAISVPPTTPHCTNGAMFTENNATTAPGRRPISGGIFSPQNGNVVGVNGSGWIVDLLFDANSAMANSLISQDAGRTNGFVAVTSPAFKPGPNLHIPGLVVLLNTTMTGAPFKGPGTNLAGLFQINNFRTVNCDTIIEIWAEWLVGKPIAGHGPSQINVFLVNGTAPAIIDDTSNLSNRQDLISDISSANIVLS